MHHPSPAAAAPAARPTRTDLLRFVRQTAAEPALLSRLTLQPSTRTWARLDGPLGSEAWVIAWPPGSGTGWHDHGGSFGAFAVAAGVLTEHTAGTRPSADHEPLRLPPGGPFEQHVAPGQGRAFGTRHVHDVVNDSASDHAVSVHAYYPPLPLMRRYRLRDGFLHLHDVEHNGSWA